METMAAVGFGLSVVSFFSRYLPSMPKEIAWAGVLAGGLLSISGIADMKIPVPAAVCLVIGFGFIGEAVHLTIRARQSPEPASNSAEKPHMGSVTNNSGIVTQGQSGDNNIQK